jgi:hypothetical protein
MFAGFRSGLIPFAAGSILAALSIPLVAQKAGGDSALSVSAVYAAETRPDAPAPQVDIAANELPDAPSAEQAAQSGVGQQNSTGQSAASQSSTSAQNSAQQPDAQETKRQKAEEEVKEQEHQRMAGIVPSFNVTYHSDAVSLTPGEKFRLEYHAATDPYTFGIAAIVAGLGEAEDSDTGYGWGPGGFAKRAAADYADNVIGNTLGNAVLPSLLHQDPRYYRLGHGSASRRLLYAAATAFICKHDNTGKWEPNYSNVLGNMIAGEISNFYSPDGDSSNVGQTIETGFTVTFEGMFGSELEEFWPDISRKFFHKDPTHGLDAQARVQDAAAKQKKQQERNQK